MTTTTSNDRRVALVADAGHYVGPALARAFAQRGHDLVIGDPAPGLVDELTELGSIVEVLTGVANLAKPDSAPALVDAALARFGKLDAAVAFSGQIIPGAFADSTIDQLRELVVGCLEAPYNFLKAACLKECSR